MGMLISEMVMDEIKIVPNGSVTTPKGYYAGGVHCGVKRKRKDLGWIYSTVPATAAAVYTTNLFQAAPLLVTQESIAVEGKLQGILVNSGNANACTGEQGLKNAYEMRNTFSKLIGVPNHYTAVVSTGVIGEQLPMEKISSGIHSIKGSIQHDDVINFQQAILTTDTFTKQFAVQLIIDGKTVSIGGAAKGSGMIHPNMATMLGFITTDANIHQADLLAALRSVTNETFNMITVDGDTSTNDMVLVLANGLSGNTQLTSEHPDWPLFVKGLEIVSKELAKKIARDGEGATKLIEVHVKGALTKQMANAIGKSIISSNLVKTAIFGSDANWGRIVCAIGYSEQPIDPMKILIQLGNISVFANGLPLPFDEEVATKYLQKETVQITVDLQMGSEYITAWGCDLTYDYVKINASYRT